MAKVRTSLEAELYAARRVGEVIKGLRLDQKLRVLELVREHMSSENGAQQVRGD